MEITHLVIHCSASPQGRGDDVETVRKWHMEKGWKDIGYHAVITEDGTIQEGRPEGVKGAHVYGMNYCSLGVCLIGEDSFTEEQFISLREVITRWKYTYPRAEVVGHRDLDPKKSCPNFDVGQWWEHTNWSF